MRYFILKNIGKDGQEFYSFIPERSDMSPEEKENHENQSFKIIEELPAPLTERDGDPYALKYNATTDSFFWEYV